MTENAVPQTNNTGSWLNTRTTMPDDDCTVMIYCPHEDEPVWMGYHGTDERWRTIEGVPIEVTFWQHLPEPPTFTKG